MGDTEHVLYLTAIRCEGCESKTTYAHEGANVPLDQEAPWPDVDCCPCCMTLYPEDLAVVIEEVANAERVEPYSLHANTERGVE